LPMASLATRPAPAPDGTTAATTGLLTARTADAYQDLLGQVTRDVAERLRTGRAPSAGPERRRPERLVEGAGRDGPGVGDAAPLGAPPLRRRRSPPPRAPRGGRGPRRPRRGRRGRPRRGRLPLRRPRGLVPPPLLSRAPQLPRRAAGRRGRGDARGDQHLRGHL